MNKDKLKIAVIGMGYVGLPLAIEFSKKKIAVVGFDINNNRIKKLKSGIDSTNEVSKIELKKTKAFFSKKLVDAKNCNVFIVTVPTPVNNSNKPNLEPLVNATKLISKILKKNDVVIYESTVFPGATEDLCGPILEKETKLKINKDFFLGYSPERINPGDKKKRIKDIVKITSGSNLKTSKFVADLYSLIIKAGIHKAQSIKIAEAAKVIENTQRDLNIAFINELSLIFKKMNISTEKVLQAAETKWNFVSFRPGLVGGHCIGVDPYYLTHKSKKIGYDPKLILAGRNLNDDMPRLIFREIIKKVKSKKILKPKILIMGLTFKENCPDTRNSKALDLFNCFDKNKYSVVSYDPYYKFWDKKFMSKFNVQDSIKNKKFDVIILAVKHQEFIKKNIKILNHCSTNGFVYDLKYILPEKNNHLRL